MEHFPQNARPDRIESITKVNSYDKEVYADFEAAKEEINQKIKELKGSLEKASSFRFASPSASPEEYTKLIEHIKNEIKVLEEQSDSLHLTFEKPTKQ